MSQDRRLIEETFPVKEVSEDARRRCIIAGVQQGLFGLGVLEDGEIRCMAYKESPTVALAGNEIIIRADICEAQREQQVEVPPPSPRDDDLTRRGGTSSGTREISSGGPVQDADVTFSPPEPVRRAVTLRFTVPRGQVSGLLGVLNLLQYKFNRLEIALHATEGEMSEQEYDSKILEAFRQLGIEWEEL